MYTTKAFACLTLVIFDFVFMYICIIYTTPENAKLLSYFNFVNYVVCYSFNSAGIQNLLLLFINL